MDKSVKSFQGEVSDKNVKYDSRGQPIGYERLLDLSYYYKEEGDFNHIMLSFPDNTPEIFCHDILRTVIGLLQDVLKNTGD